jgi:hypothetical protein
MTSLEEIARRHAEGLAGTLGEAGKLDGERRILAALRELRDEIADKLKTRADHQKWLAQEADGQDEKYAHAFAASVLMYQAVAVRSYGEK